MRRGRAVLSVRYEIADIRLNPQIQAHAFHQASRPGRLRPSPRNQPVALAAPRAVANIGRRLPDLELRDPEFKARWLSDLRGRTHSHHFLGPVVLSQG